jgi:hypothetical protein
MNMSRVESYSPLIFDFSGPLSDAVSTNNVVAVFHVLIQEKPSICGSVFYDALTAVETAIEEEYDNIVSVLVALGCEHTDGSFPIQCAARLGNASILQLCIDAGGSMKDLNDSIPDMLMRSKGDVVTRLNLLLAHPEFDITTYKHCGWIRYLNGVAPALTAALDNEASKRERWALIRVIWIASVAC